MRFLKGCLGWSLIAVLTMLFVPSARGDDAFMGSWQVHCTPTSATTDLGGDAFDDGFIFENGNFSAQAYLGMGFTPSSYTIDSTGKFTATLVSDTRGTVVWRGRVASGAIHGWITWTKADGSVFKYTYTGNVAVADTGTGD
jgi:hypothetical protein